MLQLSENLRFLLWSKRVQRREWASHLGHWANCDPGRAEELLQGNEPSERELEQIVRAVGYSMEILAHTSLLEAHEVDVLHENLRYLTDRLDYGHKKEMAAALDIHSTTITKWRNGECRPRVVHLASLCRYFGLRSDTKIEVEPIFLTVETRLDQEQRAWVRTRLEELDPITWQMVYPFLKFLLTERQGAP
jgi:transcriptional regulator with XRE-family HTH domain